MWTLQVDTYEGNQPKPVLTHLFYGATRDEATELMRRHARYDAFLRAALTTGIFQAGPGGAPFHVSVIQRWQQT